ncbi:5-hydroxytryptamine receptor 1B-like [Saccoglossus kowalevskii]|uniref:Cholecystokinin receptor-like n=1 Tax=Saccoglossus kowalevskii TaxID=10224 RepID=A0ABM0LW87_SACKO|nr:PREDICTED: cholecystokinin receptor-like [Saccoglossus kowalevskii]
MYAYLYMIAVLNVVLLVIGFFGNILVLRVYLAKTLRTSTMYFIIGLAAVDLSACVVVMPFNVYVSLRKYYFDSDVACKLLMWASFVLVNESVAITALIAVDRYLSVCRPFTRYISPYRAKIMTIATFLASILLNLPVYFIFGTSEYELGKRCGLLADTTGSWKYMFLAYFFIMFMILLLVTVILYTKVYKEVERRTRVSHSSNDTLNTISGQSVYTNTEDNTRRCSLNAATAVTECSTTESGKPERVTNDRPTDVGTHRPDLNRRIMNSTAKMLLLATIVFIVTWVPHWIIRFLPSSLINEGDSFGFICMKFIEYMFVVNNAVNPVIYCFVNKRFREDCKRALRRGCN